jgi:hypothetical protein
MNTIQLKHCLICEKDLPVSDFGRNAYYDKRGAGDGRSLYCSTCIRLKRNAEREALKEYKAAKKIRLARAAELAKAAYYDPLSDTQWPIGCQFKLSPVDRVANAIRNGCHSQAEIGLETKLGADEIGDAIAQLLLWTKEIRTEGSGEDRLYFLRAEPQRKSYVKSSSSLFEYANSLGPVMRGIADQRVGRAA